MSNIFAHASFMPSTIAAKTFLCLYLLFGGSDVDICRPPLVQSSLINYPTKTPRAHQSAQILQLHTSNICTIIEVTFIHQIWVKYLNNY